MYLNNYRYEAAEKDSTVSLHLNETYVKAFFRRIIARENLGKLKDAIKGRARLIIMLPSQCYARFYVVNVYSFSRLPISFEDRFRKQANKNKACNTRRGKRHIYYTK